VTGAGKTLLPVGGVADVDIQDTLDVVIVWLGVVVVLDKRLAVDVITDEEVIDGLTVVVLVVGGF
jgi:hypothetical protein